MLAHRFLGLPAAHLDARLLPHRFAPALHWRPAFPNRYLLISTLALADFVQTCFILSLGGEECNAIALWFMTRFGLAGAALYKFALVAGVIALIDWLSVRDALAARRLAGYALILGVIPVAIGLGLVTIHLATLLA